EIKKIETFERRVDDLYEQGKISFEDTPKEPYFDEQIYLKVSQDYYKNKGFNKGFIELEYLHEDIARVKAEYILTKDYLRSLLPKPPEKSKIQRFIGWDLHELHGDAFQLRFWIDAVQAICTKACETGEIA
ncbi:MAG: hypothetical protein R6U10_02720, partial [Thermoplasmatota archaeon]